MWLEKLLFSFEGIISNALPFLKFLIIVKKKKRSNIYWMPMNVLSITFVNFLTMSLWERSYYQFNVIKKDNKTENLNNLSTLMGFFDGRTTI